VQATDKLIIKYAEAVKKKFQKNVLSVKSAVFTQAQSHQLLSIFFRDPKEFRSAGNLERITYQFEP
jgi:hypothetical protein